MAARPNGAFVSHGLTDILRGPMAETAETPHLAELRQRAAEVGIERFRMLRREELVEQLRERGVEIAEKPARPDRGDEAPARPARRRGGAKVHMPEQPEEETPTHPAEGILDVTPRGHGFLRSGGLQAGDDDVYVSASQIRRCVLRPGDLIIGPARDPRRDERYPALVHIDQVNGAEPTEERPSFDDLTPARPSRQLEVDLSALGPDERDLIAGYSALTEIQAGERILVRAQGGTERFDLFRALAKALASKLGSDVIVLLIDVPPEELAEWQDDGGGARVAALAADSSPAAAGRVARLALEHVKRRAEAGIDAVLIVDSLTRLAVLEDDTAGVKRVFGAGRQLSNDGAGSLTIIATSLAEDDADRAVVTTESALVTLSAPGS